MAMIYIKMNIAYRLTNHIIQMDFFLFEWKKKLLVETSCWDKIEVHFEKSYIGNAKAFKKHLHMIFDITTHQHNSLFREIPMETMQQHRHCYDNITCNEYTLALNDCNMHIYNKICKPFYSI